MACAGAKSGCLLRDMRTLATFVLVLLALDAVVSTVLAYLAFESVIFAGAGFVFAGSSLTAVIGVGLIAAINAQTAALERVAAAAAVQTRVPVAPAVAPAAPAAPAPAAPADVLALADRAANAAAQIGR